MNHKTKKIFQVSNFKLHNSSGFTLMEIMVASTIFVVVSVSMLSLFNYVLKINRRTEALRQASQGMRNFVEFLVKEVRNGKVDYYVSNQSYDQRMNNGDPNVPCGPPASGSVPISGALSTYQTQDNKLGIIDTDNVKECFFYGKDDGSYVDAIGSSPTTFSAPSGHNYTMVLDKQGVTNPITGYSNPQILNPPNLRIDNLEFIIRPKCDPYTASCGDYANNYPKIQPSVTIIIKFIVKLPTGEQVPIYYQTSVSENKYDIPSHS